MCNANHIPASNRKYMLVVGCGRGQLAIGINYNRSSPNHQGMNIPMVVDPDWPLAPNRSLDLCICHTITSGIIAACSLIVREQLQQGIPLKSSLLYFICNPVLPFSSLHWKSPAIGFDYNSWNIDNIIDCPISSCHFLNTKFICWSIPYIDHLINNIFSSII